MNTAFTNRARSSRSRRKKLPWKGRRSSSGRLVQEVRRQEQQSALLDDRSLKGEAQELRAKASRKSKIGLAETVRYSGLIAEVVNRTFGFRLHDVQVRGMLAGYQGAIVEMQTGEGKTIVTGAIAALKSLQSKSIHVATTNAYLAARDCEELQPVFERLGLSCGILPEDSDLSATQKAYGKTITYGPGYQFGFDYLRDQVVLRNNRQSDLGRKTLDAIRGHDIRKRLNQPQLHDAMIIDEADSVMIDEAVTPLVISGASREKADPEPFLLAQQIARKLEPAQDFTIELPDKKIEVNDAAMERCHAAVSDNKDLQLERPWRIYISNAIRADHVLQRDVDYVVQDNEVQIVDQNTGRIFSDRTWQDGLHQAVEAKESVEIKSAANSVARITRQRYLQMYHQLAGLTGTAQAVAQEFQSVYQTPVIQIPTHLPCQRKRMPCRFFADTDSKLAAIVLDVRQRNQKGQPILIGTRTIQESKLIAESLSQAGINAVLLNGVQDRDEAEIVSQAGAAGAITIATNMAGRGTDIKLDSAALEAGGLHVIGVSPNGSTRIDRQLVGRAARQGNPGSAQFFVSPDDEVVATYAPRLGQRMISRASRSGECVVSFSTELLAVQNEIEHKQFQIRQSMVRQDHWMDLVRETIEG